MGVGIRVVGVGCEMAVVGVGGGSLVEGGVGVGVGGGSNVATPVGGETSRVGAAIDGAVASSVGVHAARRTAIVRTTAEIRAMTQSKR